MARSKIHDIVPPNRSSKQRNTQHHGAASEQATSPPRTRRARRSSSKRPGWKLWTGAIVLVLLIGFFAASVFSSTELTVTPKQETVFVNSSFTARTGTSTQPATELAISDRTLTEQASRTVSARGTETVSKRASGTIIVYNDHSAQSQRLVEQTRFQTPDGLIYKTQEPITVPGQQTKNDETVPGSISVEVVAAEPGEQYNIAKTDFTIPGLNGSPLYENFYARSKTQMTGGFAGERLVVAEDAREQAQTQLEQTLREQLTTAAREQTPDGHVLFENMIFVEYQPMEQEKQDSETVTLTRTATAHALTFENATLAAAIARAALPGYDGAPIRLQNPDALQLTRETERANPWRQDKIPFALTGNADLVWTFDSAKLKADLLGREQAALPTILSGYPSIERAEARIRPFWQQTFPGTPAEITITQQQID